MGKGNVYQQGGMRWCPACSRRALFRGQIVCDPCDAEFDAKAVMEDAGQSRSMANRRR